MIGALRIAVHKKAAPTIANEFSGKIHQSNREPNLIEIVDRKDFASKVSTGFLTSQYVELHRRYRSKVAVLVDQFNRTLPDLLEEQIFLKNCNLY